MKGQLSLQFNWIWVLVGGVLFLIFFLLIVRNLTNFGEGQQVRAANFNVKTIVFASLAEPNEFQIHDVADATYTFACSADDDGILESYVRVDDGSYEQRAFEFIPVFSHHTLEGRQLFTLSKPLAAPFPVTNLVLVSNNRTQLVFVRGAGNDLDRVEDLLLREGINRFNVESIAVGTLDTFKDAGHDHYRYIFFDEPYIRPPVAGSALVVDTRSGLMDFYDSTEAPPSAQDIHYYGNGMLLAAAFASSFEEYTCNLGKTRPQFSTVTTVLQSRLQPLQDSFPQCRSLYTEASTLLANEFDPLENLAPLASNLERVNDRLLQRNCPLVY